MTEAFSICINYLFAFLWKNFTISTTGITSKPSAIAIIYSAKLTLVNSNALARNGILHTKEINRDVNDYPFSTKESGKEEWHIPYKYFAEAIKQQFGISK